MTAANRSAGPPRPKLRQGPRQNTRRRKCSGGRGDDRDAPALRRRYFMRGARIRPRHGIARKQRAQGKHPARTADGCVVFQAALPQHFLNFSPDPQGHGSLRPTLLEA